MHVFIFASAVLDGLRFHTMFEKMRHLCRSAVCKICTVKYSTVLYNYLSILLCTSGQVLARDTIGLVSKHKSISVRCY